MSVYVYLLKLVALSKIININKQAEPTLLSSRRDFA